MSDIHDLLKKKLDNPQRSTEYLRDPAQPETPRSGGLARQIALQHHGKLNELIHGSFVDLVQFVADVWAAETGWIDAAVKEIGESLMQSEGEFWPHRIREIIARHAAHPSQAAAPDGVERLAREIAKHVLTDENWSTITLQVLLRRHLQAEPEYLRPKNVACRHGNFECAGCDDEDAAFQAAIDKERSQFASQPPARVGALTHRPDKAEHGTCKCRACVAVDEQGVRFGLFDLLTPDQVKTVKQFAVAAALAALEEK